MMIKMMRSLQSCEEHYMKENETIQFSQIKSQYLSPTLITVIVIIMSFRYMNIYLFMLSGSNKIITFNEVRTFLLLSNLILQFTISPKTSQVP